MRGGYDRICEIYFIQAKGGGPIKIGATNDIEKRICGLQAWSSFPLVLLCKVTSVFLAESVLHEMQQDYHSHFEWFEPNTQLLEIIESIKSTGEFPPAVAAELDFRYTSRLAAEVETVRRSQKSKLKRNSAMALVGEKTRQKMSLASVEQHARRKAARGHNRAYDFQIVAVPKSDPKN